jgi:hypothetical protein
MGNLFTNILVFFTDKSRSLGSRGLFLVIFLSTFFVLDYFSGLTFYIATSFKLDQIEKIEKIKIENPNNIDLHEELNKIESELIQRKNIQEYFSFFENPPKDSLKINKFNSLNPSESTLDISFIRRSNILHIVTSSYSFVIIILILPFTFFTEKRTDKNFIVGIIFGIIILLGLTWFFSYLFSLIPLLKYPWINYMLNIFLHTLFLIAISKTTKKNANIGEKGEFPSSVP